MTTALLLFWTLAWSSVLAAEPLAGPRNLEDCQARFADRPGDKETSLCYYELAAGETSTEEGRRAKRELVRLAAEYSDHPWLGYYAANLHYAADAAVAEDLYRQAAESFHALGDTAGEVNTRINRSKLLARLGRDQDARAEVEIVLALTETSDDPELRARGQVEMARRLFHAGEDLGRAYAVLRAMSSETARREESYSMHRDRLVLLGSVCLLIGREDEARRAFEDLVEIAVGKDDGWAEANARYHLALISFWKLGDAPTGSRLEETRSLAHEALQVASSVSHRTIEAKAAWLLGWMAPGEQRNRYLEHCLSAAPAADLKSYCMSALAVWQSRSDPAQAMESVATALELAGEAEDPWWTIFAQRASMRVRWEAASPAAALSTSWSALDTLESLRARQSQGSAAQAGVFSVWSDDYAWLAGRILERAGEGLPRERATAEAFRVSERMRARALTDWLRSADPDAAGAVAGEFRGLAEVQLALARGEALLSFQVAPWDDLSGDFGGGSWVIAVTRDGVDFHRLPGRVELRRAVGLFEGLLERRDGAEAGVAARLYEQLLAAALAGLPAEVDRLILVPDDALHRLPFAALRASADADPLGVRYELVRVPSATLWLGWRDAPTEAPGRPLLVLADPDPPAAGREADAPEVEVAQVRDAAQALGRLPHARREGRAAVRALGGGRLLLGPEASEARLGELPLGDFGLVHFAAHAVTDEDRPERSAVLLTPGGGQDGLLRSAEIAGLDLAGRTVVLASCRSASGTVLRGEGVMSLARAFFQAGAHGVVASLWPLRDDESEALFGRVYRHLGDGVSVAEALHRARREAFDAGEPAAAWAGLVVLGDGAATALPGGGPPAADSGAGRLALWGLLGFVLVAGAVGAWLLRRRSP